MARKASEQQLSTLIINKVDSEDTFQEMVEGELVNEDELYLVESGSGNELGLSVINGVLCQTFDGQYTPWYDDDGGSGPISNAQIDNLF